MMMERLRFAAAVVPIAAVFCGYAAHTARAAVAPAAAVQTGESAPPGETMTMRRIVDAFERMVTQTYHKSGHGVRGAHAKGQGCVRATVRIARNVPPPLRHGVFAAPTTYRAWVRFSNGAGEVRVDGAPDGRGMAIKLTGVAGPKLIDDERHTQDFVMINFPAFFISDVAEYELLADALEKNRLPAFLKAHPESAKLAAQIAGVPTHDLLRNSYFSMTPYLLGSTYAKFGSFPVSCSGGAALTPDTTGGVADADYLRERLVASLSREPACFDLRLQPRTDPATMPIENAMVTWEAAAAPFVTVARVTIPPQTFDSPQQQTFCENLSYSPWHGTSDFRPVGGLNRLRLFVYRAISKLRHELNQASFIEPTGSETFDNTP